MPSVKRIRASDESGNASQATVTAIRAADATTLHVDTVADIYAGSEGFYATMGTPHTFTDPVTGETFTVISEATAVDFRGHIDTGNIEIDEIAPGYTDAGSAVGDIVIIRPTTQWADNVSDVLAEAHDDDGSLKSYFRDQFSDFVEKSGAVWSQTSGLVGAMTAGYIWYQGKRYAANVIASHTFTASKDTYVDIDPTTGDATYVEEANNATEPAITANNVRIAKVVTSASAITSVSQSTYQAQVTSSNLRPNKYVDANGWTVYDYGTWKEYVKSHSTTTTLSFAAAGSPGDTKTIWDTGNLPVGISQASDCDDITFTCRSPMANCIISINNADTDTSITVIGHNSYAAATQSMSHNTTYVKIKK